MSNLTSDELHHAGRKGMKWGMNIFGRRQPKGGVRGKRGAKPEQQNVKMPKKPRRSVDERLREAEFRDAYRTRDNMSTKALKSKIARLEAEQRFKQLVEAPEKARLEALQKKKQARLAFIGKVGSAALDVYSKAPSSIAGRNLSGQAAKDAIEAFKKRQEWAKAFKDVPTTMTKFTQSINVGSVDVYIPETIQNRFMIQHAGRKGMKWGRHIFGDPNRRAFNKAVRGTRRVVKAFDKLQKNGRLRDNNILAESESINSVMTKGGVKYNPKIHNSATMRDIKTIIRNNKILKDRTLGTDKDSMAIEKAANVLNYGSKGNKNSLSKLTSNSTDSKAGNAALPSALSTIGGATTGVSLGIYGKRKYDEYNSQQDQGKRLFKTSAPSRYSKDKIDPNVRKSIISTINNHEHTSYSIKDQNGKETISANIKRYSKPSWDFSGNGPTFSDGIVSKKWRSGAINHKGVNMGEFINGVYMPSQEDLLLHYGKKGMKWKKKGKPGSAPMSAAEMAAMEERIKKEEKSYNYNLQMRDKAIENALKRGASGKEIRRLQDMREDDQRKVDMNKKHKEAMKKKDNRRSSYDRSVEVVDATNPKKPKSKTYKY